MHQLEVCFLMSNVSFCEKKSYMDINMYVCLEKDPYVGLQVFTGGFLPPAYLLLIVWHSTCVVFVTK